GHLTLGQLVLWMRLEPWVIHFLDPWVLEQKLGDSTTIFVVLPHSNCQRLCAPHDQPGIHRRKNSASRVLNKSQLPYILAVIQYHGASDAIAVSIQILGS